MLLVQNVASHGSHVQTKSDGSFGRNAQVNGRGVSATGAHHIKRHQCEQPDHTQAGLIKHAVESNFLDLSQIRVRKLSIHIG